MGLDNLHPGDGGVITGELMPYIAIYAAAVVSILWAFNAFQRYMARELDWYTAKQMSRWKVIFAAFGGFAGPIAIFGGVLCAVVSEALARRAGSRIIQWLSRPVFKRCNDA